MKVLTTRGMVMETTATPWNCKGHYYYCAHPLNQLDRTVLLVSWKIRAKEMVCEHIMKLTFFLAPFHWSPCINCAFRAGSTN